ncbi:MAG: hypothetical protein NC828_01615, partial [Candidatus Omnitrophica bacterium]|nr:hypothetical protein [Candidatus Omnitrophota bacterium]
MAISKVKVKDKSVKRALAEADSQFDDLQSNLDETNENLYALETAFNTHTHIRVDVTDFWNSPFWNNIPDKPTEYNPQAH